MGTSVLFVDDNDAEGINLANFLYVFPALVSMIARTLSNSLANHKKNLLILFIFNNKKPSLYHFGCCGGVELPFLRKKEEANCPPPPPPPPPRSLVLNDVGLRIISINVCSSWTICFCL